LLNFYWRPLLNVRVIDVSAYHKGRLFLGLIRYSQHIGTGMPELPVGIIRRLIIMLSMVCSTTGSSGSTVNISLSEIEREYYRAISYQRETPSLSTTWRKEPVWIGNQEGKVTGRGKFSPLVYPVSPLCLSFSPSTPPPPFPSCFPTVQEAALSGLCSDLCIEFFFLRLFHSFE